MQGKPTMSGFIMAITAAVFWGLSGTCAQFLFEHRQVDPAWLVCVRLLSAGALLLVFAFARRGSDALLIWKNPKDALQLVIFSILGMLAVQYSYFYSISLSNAATATVLQYIGPVFVVAFYALKHRRWPVLVEYAALFLALAGTFLLVTHGSFSQLVITQKALLWGLLSAFTLAFYTIQPVQLLRKYSAASVTGWGMLLGGICFSFLVSPWKASGYWDGGTWLAFTGIILFGSLLAFYLFLSSVNKIGAPAASLLCSVEPLSAALLAMAWLHVPFGKMDWLGTIFILVTIVLLTLGTKPAQTTDQLA